MAEALTNPGPTVRPRFGEVNARGRHSLVAVAVGTVLTGAVLGIAATAPSSGSALATAATTRAARADTIETQAGTVTAVSPMSITIKSPDGLARSYRVSAGTMVDCKHDAITAVKVGDPVAVTAAVTAGTAKVTDIVDGDMGAHRLPPALLPASPLAPVFSSCLSQIGTPQGT